LKPGSASNKKSGSGSKFITQHNHTTFETYRGGEGGGLKVQEVAFLESLLASTIVNGKKEKHRECKK